MQNSIMGVTVDDDSTSHINISVETENGEERKVVKYNKELFFPLTRWLQMNRNERVTHQKYDEFNSLCVEIRSEMCVSMSEQKSKYLLDNLIRHIQDAILHLWDVRGELRPWIVKRACMCLVGHQTPSDRYSPTRVLPAPSRNASKREREFRGGPNGIEMSLSNIGSVVMGEDKPFNSEEIQSKIEKGDGLPDYDHDIEKYLK